MCFYYFFTLIFIFCLIISCSNGDFRNSISSQRKFRWARDIDRSTRARQHSTRVACLYAYGYVFLANQIAKSRLANQDAWVVVTPTRSNMIYDTAARHACSAHAVIEHCSQDCFSQSGFPRRRVTHPNACRHTAHAVARTQPTSSIVSFRLFFFLASATLIGLALL